MRLQPVATEKSQKSSNAMPAFRSWASTRLQAKPAIGPLNDIYEQEADRVAEEVSSRALRPPAFSPARTQDKSDNLLSPEPEYEGRTVSPDGDSLVRSTGQPLDRATRASMEARFGHDFAKVRVHADETAARSAYALGARAYTVDQHIVFGRGEFVPMTTAGQKLLAHELVHTIQQSHARSKEPAPGSRAPLSFAAARGHSLHLHQTGGPRVMCTFSREVDARFRAFNIVGDDLSNPDVLKWINDLTEEDLKKYRENVRDPKVKEHITNVLGNRPGKFGPEYGGRFPDVPRKNVPKFEATTSMSNIQGAIPAPSCISMESLKKIFPDFAKDIEADKDKIKAGKSKAEKAETYLKNLNDAFKIMKIDTIQAQAHYLAHSFVESDQFRAMTESQKAVKDVDQMWMDKPSEVQIATGSIGRDDSGNLTPAYQPGGDINPSGNFEFLGRGPVQVTGRKAYLQVIAELESVADFYFRHKDYANAKVARDAANAVRAKPESAADPQYAFLVSAALMKYRQGDRRSGGPYDPVRAGDWVSGGGLAPGSTQDKRLTDKTDAYQRAFCVLLQDAKAENIPVPERIVKACGAYSGGVACGSAKSPAAAGPSKAAKPPSERPDSIGSIR